MVRRRQAVSRDLNFLERLYKLDTIAPFGSKFHNEDAERREYIAHAREQRLDLENQHCSPVKLSAWTEMQHEWQLIMADEQAREQGVANATLQRMVREIGKVMRLEAPRSYDFGDTPMVFRCISGDTNEVLVQCPTKRDPYSAPSPWRTMPKHAMRRIRSKRWYPEDDYPEDDQCEDESPDDDFDGGY